MQLWGMLGRKVGTLGKVVDGDKHASLNAQLCEDSSIPGRSVQDELQTFFAETSPQDSSSSLKVPVKGTIMSFFQKQTQQQATPKETNKAQRANDGTSCFAPKVEWACQACTFVNSKIRPKSGWLPCEMCGASYVEDSPENKKSPAVTPPSTRKANGIANTEDHLGNDNLIVIDGSPNKPAQQTTATTNSTSTSPRDPIVLDNDDDDDASPVISSSKSRPNTTHPPTQTSWTMSPTSIQESPIVLDHDDDSRQVVSKKARTSQVIVLDDNELNAKDKQSKTSALSFSVSKNSGRITIHYNSDGKSSLTNFQMEQVVSEETTERLLEAKVDRHSKKKVGISIDFNRQAIQRGKFSCEILYIDLFFSLKTFTNFPAFMTMYL
jgi:hypothetical protein